MAGAGRAVPTCLVLGVAGGGKSLLARRLRQLSAEEGPAELGEPPATLPTVGTNLTDLRLPRTVTLRELGGCMGPIWQSYYGECSALLFVVDAADPTQVSSSCVQLLAVLSAAPLAAVPVLILFNKMLAWAVETPEPGAGLAGEPALWADADRPAGAVTCPAPCPWRR
ncbi:ADP-ribosylation factor-like protein 16 isoform X2 [Pezoporus wallicus]|uniref:ADP-ribosylation factor-like protein 16 isoform X2 n=1 Tax=Pezoporus wallicus TaxID=35540 RepID=UPI00254C973B|nr:ADP-ribosylation factor-like protein 16 isoform X2 [Pezoporus wallicus]XP_061335853.1 ADP-ribosylation factor-like protein 16 isoform X2 [Pezoporus flaviventris]